MSLNPALYLEISGPTQASVDAAVARIKDIIENGLIEVKAPSTTEVKGALTDKVFLPFAFDYARMGSYNIRGKMIGPQGAYIKHINASTNVECSIRGRGSGYVELGSAPSNTSEPIYLYIQGFREGDMKLARALCEDLLQSVQQEYQAEYAKIVPPSNTPYYGNPYAQMQTGTYGYYNQMPGMQYPMGYTYAQPGMMHSTNNTPSSMPYTGSFVQTTPAVSQSGMSLEYPMPSPSMQYPYSTYSAQTQGVNQKVDSIAKEPSKDDVHKSPLKVSTEEADPLDPSSQFGQELKDYSAVPPPPNLNAPSRMRNNKK